MNRARIFAHFQSRFTWLVESLLVFPPCVSKKWLRATSRQATISSRSSTKLYAPNSAKSFHCNRTRLLRGNEGRLFGLSLPICIVGLRGGSCVLPPSACFGVTRVSVFVRGWRNWQKVYGHRHFRCAHEKRLVTFCQAFHIKTSYRFHSFIHSFIHLFWQDCRKAKVDAYQSHAPDWITWEKKKEEREKRRDKKEKIKKILNVHV